MNKLANLVIQSYPIKDVNKLNEHMFCFEKNLDNPFIKKIYNFKEEGFEYPENILNNKNYKTKVVNLKVDKTKTKPKSERFIPQHYYAYTRDFDINKNDTSKRITYKYVVDWVRENLEENEIIIITNCDIFFDYNWDYNKLYDILNHNFFMVLSRYEFDKGNKIWIDYNCMKAWSNDTWIFLNTSKLENVKNINFTVGACPSCDFAIIERFYKGGYNVINGGLYFPSFHYDRITKENSHKLYINNYNDLSYPSLDGNLFICPFFPIDIYKLENYYELIPRIHILTSNKCLEKECSHEHSVEDLI
jgi:hypothetical protein